MTTPTLKWDLAGGPPAFSRRQMLKSEAVARKWIDP